MKILVTGGAGFIGSHLVDRLLGKGHEVTVLDDLTTGSDRNLSQHAQIESFNFVKGSVLDSELVAELVAKTDYIFHLAAAVGVFNIVNEPLKSLLTNVRGTENLLFFANQFGVPILITSSSEVYGKNASDSLRESDDRILGSPLTLRWSYSEAKAIDESLAFAYFVEKKLETRIVRFFNTVGSRQLGAYGMVLPRFIDAALNNSPLTIYGSGAQTRCFAHVSDVVDALILVAFSLDTIGKVINIGNNVEISMTELAKRIVQRTKSTSELIYVPYKDAYGDGFEDMERRVPNIDLIKELVGWSPQLDLDQIIDEIIANSTRIS